MNDCALKLISMDLCDMIKGRRTYLHPKKVIFKRMGSYVCGKLCNWNSGFDDVPNTVLPTLFGASYVRIYGAIYRGTPIKDYTVLFL